MDERISLSLEGREVHVGLWKFTITGVTGGEVVIYFMENAGSPRIGIFGGAKVGGKIEVIRNRGDSFDHSLLGAAQLHPSGLETGRNTCRTFHRSAGRPQGWA